MFGLLIKLSTSTPATGRIFRTGPAIPGRHVLGVGNQPADRLRGERVSGSGHPQTLSIRDNIAYFTGEAGDAAGARDQFATLLPIRERVSGPEYPETLSVRHILAYWTGKTRKGGA